VPWYQLDRQTIVVKLLPGWDGRIVQWEIDWPCSEKVTTEVELLGPRKLYALPLNQSAHLPGAGWCRATLVVRLGRYASIRSRSSRRPARDAARPASRAPAHRPPPGR
jgi:hypothetical protein